MEEILNSKIIDFSNYLLSICNNEKKKKLIKEKMSNLKLYEILLFVSFLQKNNINTEINLLFTTFDLENNEENKQNVLNYIEYFLKI